MTKKRQYIALALILVILLCLSPFVRPAFPYAYKVVKRRVVYMFNHDYVPDEVIVKLKVKAFNLREEPGRQGAEAFFHEIDPSFQIDDYNRSLNFVVLKLPKKGMVLRTIERLEIKPEIEYAEPNWIIRAVNKGEWF
ncbi:hypothetical protein JW752_03205 [Candidatus Peregrinibacteria bacterium]|nr:hypothetical protein [Candidatus Peregrinibacteria bacterium]